MMIPIILELRKRSEFEISTLGLSIASEALGNAGIEHHTLIKYKSLIMDDSAWKLGKLLAEEMHVDGKGISFEETVVYFGASMRDLVREIGEEEAFRKFRQEGKACFIPNYTMSFILEAEKPDLLITGNCPRMERAAIQVASEKGIRVLSLNDLLGFDKKYLFTADRIAVISRLTKENLIKAGNQADKIVVTGSPSFDLILDEIQAFKRSEILQELGLTADAKLFLLATQPQKTCTWKMIDMMIDLLETYPGKHLLIKPHPGDDNRLYTDYLAKKNDTRVVLTDMPVRKLIFISDLTVTIYSTVGLEAILMGAPLIQLNLMGIPNPIPFFNYGVSMEAHNYEELKNAADKMLNEEQTKTEISKNRAKYFGEMLSGKGLENCINLVYELLPLDGNRAL